MEALAGLRRYFEGNDLVAAGLDLEMANDGGAIALTYPLAASAVRINVHLMHGLRRRGGRYALGPACIDGGRGRAVIVEDLT